jgi:hypothetical protein
MFPPAPATMTDHGAATIKDWLEDLIETAKSGARFETSAGADQGRSYAYLEFHRDDGSHSVLLFRLEDEGDRPLVRAHRFDGDADQVRERINEMVPSGDRPAR